MGFREDIYIHVNRQSGQGGAGSGEVDMAVGRKRMEGESGIQRFRMGAP